MAWTLWSSVLDIVFTFTEDNYNLKMSKLNKVFFFVKEVAELMVNAFNLQVERAVRLVKKPPKKAPISWDSIIGEDAHRKTRKSGAANSQDLATLSKTNRLLLELPIEVFEELLRRIQANLIDEIQAIRMYEKLFDCEVLILRGHVHFYQCTDSAKKETIDYSTLSGRLIQLFLEHQNAISSEF